MSMKILITDYHCASNRGDAAIFEGIYKTLKDTYPESTITVLTEYPRAAEIIHGISAERQVLADFRWGISKKNAVRTFLSFTSPAYNLGIQPPFFDYIEEHANTKPYHDADLVVSTGGHHITDYYFPEKLGMLWEHYYLSQINTPVVLFSQTIGPIDKFPYDIITKQVLDTSDLIMVRDRISEEVVLNMNISTPVHLTADAAFAMDTEVKEGLPIEAIQDKECLPRNGKGVVSISVREWSHSGIKIDNYIQEIAKFSDWIINSMDMNVVFVSTCTGLDGYHKDDRLVAAQVVDKMQYSGGKQVQILSGEYTPQQLVKIYDEVDIHVGTRMHSNILAILSGTPVIAIQYQFKTKGLMEMFEVEDYLLPIEDVTLENLTAKFEACRQNSDKISSLIETNLPGVQKRAQKSGMLIKNELSVGIK